MILLEIIAFITTLLCVHLTVRENIYSWPLGIISNIVFFIIFYHNNLFGEMFLQIVFIIQSIQGWVNWGTKKNNLSITKLNNKNFLIDLGLIIIISYIVSKPNLVSFLDIFTAAASLYATYYLVNKYIQTWILWILVDLILIGLFTYKGLYISASLYLILLIMATTGLITWYKTLKNNNHEKV